MCNNNICTNVLIENKNNCEWDKKKFGKLKAIKNTDNSSRAW